MGSIPTLCIILCLLIGDGVSSGVIDDGLEGFGGDLGRWGGVRIELVQLPGGYSPSWFLGLSVLGVFYFFK